MKFLWTTSDKVGARFIRWGLNSDCSHFAICFDEDLGGIVFHSHGSGAQLEWMGEFLKKNTVVHALTFSSPLLLQDEEDIYRQLVSAYGTNSYDYPALLWWTWRGVLRKFFGIPIGTKNQWAQKGMALCTALAGSIKWISLHAKEHNLDLEMISPHDLFVLMQVSGYFRATSIPENVYG